MTPQRIETISYPIEQIYEDMTDDLLLNIAKHLNSSTWTWTALHEIETLEQMGQLTEENTKIINSYVRKIPQAVLDAMNDSRLEALSEIEQKLQNAALNGYLVDPVTDSTVAVMEAFSQQALSQLNLVNQTMLNSSLTAYQTGLYTMRQGMTTITDETELDEAQKIIDIAAGKTALGSETRTGALRKALRQLNYNGITGFYDKIGRSWSAEAYVNMDIRTTVHNTYIQSVRSRQEDYGSDVFQVSAHAGARPLCYPYQGKLYSWGDSGGYITLGDGKRYKYGSINETSYGKPAGLFGINCGHVPYPMIAGVSEKVDEKIQPKAENDREYQESQQQRSLERAIRYQKRELAMLGNNATQADKDALRRAQANMRAFIEETGRTRRYDREQIVTESKKRPINVNGVVSIDSYPKSKIDPAAKDILNGVLEDTAKKYRIKLNGVEAMSDEEMLDSINSAANVDPVTHILAYNPIHFSNIKNLRAFIARQVKTRQSVQVAEKDYDRYVAIHESKHLILDVETNYKPNKKNKTQDEIAAEKVNDLFEEYKKTINYLNGIIKATDDESLKAEFSRVLISRYSLKNADEFLAEAATMADIGLYPNEYAEEVARILDEHMRAK